MKTSLLVEADGEPLGITGAGANVPDTQLLAAAVEAVVLDRPPVDADYEQSLALDKAYDNDPGYGVCLDHDSIPHIALKRDERPTRPT